MHAGVRADLRGAGGFLRATPLPAGSGESETNASIGFRCLIGNVICLLWSSLLAWLIISSLRRTFSALFCLENTPSIPKILCSGLPYVEILQNLLLCTSSRMGIPKLIVMPWVVARSRLISRARKGRSMDPSLDE